jgi:transcriptional regulator NrdR family protein
MPAIQIPCPKCTSKITYVVSSGHDEEGRIVRRRSCNKCKHRWYTLQYPEIEISKYQLAWHNKKPFFKQNNNGKIQKDHSVSTR